MAFTFGQHIMLQDTSLYADTLINNQLLDFTNNRYEESVSLTENIYFIKLSIQPMLGKQIIINIKFIDHDDNQVLFKTVTVNPAEQYMVDLYDLNMRMKNLNETISEGGTLKTEYDRYYEAVEEQKIIVKDLEEHKDESAQALINYEAAYKILKEYEALLKETTIKMSNVNQELTDLIKNYTAYLSDIRILYNQSLSLKNVTYKKIIIAYETEDITNNENIYIAQTSLIANLSILKINEILGNNNLIPRQILKRFAIQGAANTHFFINNRETIIGNNQIFELAIPQIKIYSLKVVPDGHPFIIDYEYQEEE